MKVNNLLRLAILAATLFAVTSIYIYSRFTVDDAFITWRYGKNLINHGVWNYSPSLTDPTQAYTNPIFALLGLIPPAMGWDVVLFFKLLSLSLYALFFAWMIKVTGRNWLMVLLFLGLPASVVHTFSGLETTLYVFLIAALLVALHQKRFYLSIYLSLLLFVTRPESWILVCALPGFWFFVEPVRRNSELSTSTPVRRTTICLMALGLPLATYFALHVVLFGDALPNTFYAKSGAGFQPKVAFKLCLYALPLLFAFRRNQWPLIGVSVMLFGGMILSYSNSELQMNYSQRFSFHVFAPCYVFGLYLLTLKTQPSGKIESQASTPEPGVSSAGDFLEGVLIRGVLVVLLARFFYESGKWPDYEATYYQRALAAHAAVGKKISDVATKYNIKSFSAGDAGMIAYHSDLCALDNVGLASAKLTRGTSAEALFDLYGLDIIIFYTKNGSPYQEICHQAQLLSWAEKRGMFKVGDLYWRPDYILSIYAKRKIPEIEEVCLSSRATNSISEAEMKRATLPVPPWFYWHE